MAGDAADLGVVNLNSGLGSQLISFNIEEAASLR